MNIKKENDLQKYILMLITKPEDERLVEKAFSGLGLPIIFKLRGHGTAESELLDICGLDGTLRHINLCLINRAAISNVLCRLGEQLKLKKRGHGIAAALRITGLQETIRQIVEEEERGLMPNNSDIPGKEGARGMKDRKEDKDSFGSGDGKATTDTGKGGADMASERMYSMIFVAAEQGYSEDIIAAARTAGARGGTVIRGRRSGSESAMTLLGVATQEEQEFTMIIVDRDKRAAVMQAISSACGLKTEAHGMVISLPVEAALGLE